jgi:succinoglycan biosynthesis transport protein ExoP
MKKIEPGTQLISDAQIVSETPAIEVQPNARLGVRDILYILFRHKKKIVVLGLLGIVAAAAVFLNRSAAYESKAKLLVDYVLSRNLADSVESEVGTSSGRSMKSVLNAELEILTSRDLALKVAEKIGPEKILPDAEPEATALGASLAIYRGLTVQNGRDSQVISVSYRNKDPELAVEILNEFVGQYFLMHLEVHRSGGAVYETTKRLDEVKGELSKVDSDLLELSKIRDITAITEQLVLLGQRKTKAEEELMLAQAEVVGLQARLAAAEGRISPPVDDETIEIPKAQASDEEAEEYRKALAQIDGFELARSQILNTYTEGSDRAKTNQRRLDEAKAKRAKMLKKSPNLARTVLSLPGGTPGAGLQEASLDEARGQLFSLMARSKFLLDRKTAIEADYKSLADLAPQVADLERKKRLVAEKFALASVAQQQAVSDQALISSDITKMPNIDIIEHPSIAVVAGSKTTMMLAVALGGGGLAFGIALALLIELFLDNSIKRPDEIESRLRLPLMLSIPLLKVPEVRNGSRGKRRLLTGEGKAKRNGNGNGNSETAGGGSEMIPDPQSSAPPSRWDHDHFIRPFTDAIRDRVGHQFDVNGMKHKPKLVALTGFSDDAGTSTLAASLAASFAETVDGKVLFVDLNGDSDEEAEQIAGDSSDENLVTQDGEGEVGFREQSENLFVATIPTQNGKSKRFLPSKLYDLLPQFKSSDFEFIIFDMPLIDPMSPTMAMAGFMDKVLLVVDAGKTGRDVLKRSYEELIATRADVSTILNKTSDSLPSWLQG